MSAQLGHRSNSSHPAADTGASDPMALGPADVALAAADTLAPCQAAAGYSAIRQSASEHGAVVSSYGDTDPGHRGANIAMMPAQPFSSDAKGDCPAVDMVLDPEGVQEGGDVEEMADLMLQRSER